MTKEEFKNKILEFYQIDEKTLSSRQSFIDSNSYINAKENKDYRKVVDKLKELANNNIKTLIYGDYDYDGMSSTTIIYRSLRQLGHTDLKYFIPSRYIEGYGLNKDRVLDAIKKGYKAIICVDNGINKIDEIQLAISNGIQVIVIDHHELGECTLPPTPYIFHQFISNLTNYNMSAACLCFLVSYGLLGRYDQYLETLAGLAVISDCMPVINMNLALLRSALRNIKTVEFSQLMPMFEGIPTKDLSYYDLSVKIISKFNAVARMCEKYESNKVVEFLSSDNFNLKLFSYFDFINDQKKEIVNNIVSNLKTSKNNYEFLEVAAPIGLTGLIAGRINNGKDVVGVFCPKKDSDELVGSIRSKENYNLIEAINDCKHLLVAFGGHANACGATVKKDKFNEFVNKLKESLNKFKIPNYKNNFIEIDYEDLNRENYDFLMELQPFGTGFVEPLFAIDVPYENLKIDPVKKYFMLNSNKTRTVALFNIDDNLLNRKFTKIKFIGNFTYQSFRGIDNFKLFANSYQIDNFN